jgi:hypothetical protein
MQHHPTATSAVWRAVKETAAVIMGALRALMTLHEAEPPANS